MIRVNLLRDQTLRVRKPVIHPTVSRMGLVLLVLLALLVAALGLWWYSVDHQIKSLAVTRDKLRVENARLTSLKKEIGEFEKLKRLRESRIDVIEKLKEHQSDPVILLNYIIRSVPREPALWLTLLDQKGERIQIVGYAERNDAIPDFMNNLSQTGFFRSVDLESIEEEKDAAKFSLTCIHTRKLPTE